MNPIRWLLVYDLSREDEETLAREIGRADPNLEHVGPVAESKSEAIERLRNNDVDVVLVDMGLPRAKGEPPDRSHGVACAEEIHELSRKTKILMVSNNRIDPDSRAECQLIKRLDAIEVIGYLNNMFMSYKKYAAAIHEANQGQATFVLGDQPFSVWQKCLDALDHPCIDRLDPLTETEHSAMIFMARDGMNSQDIAVVMNVKADAVDGYLDRAREKLGGLKNRFQLQRWAFENCPDCTLNTMGRVNEARPRGRRRVP